jgi:hypothetical protein
MRVILLLIFLPLSLYSQQLVYRVVIDTMQYHNAIMNYQVVLSPNSIFNSTVVNNLSSVKHFLRVVQKRNTNEYTIYSFSGNVGTFIFDRFAFPQDAFVSISQTIINSDDNWEYLVNYSSDGSEKTPLFKVADHNGNILLADTGLAMYGYDGKNTYVCVNDETVGNLFLKAWRFRTDASSASPQLAKKNSIPGPIMSLMPSGDFRVSLQPTTTGETSIQIFDMLGKQIFSQIVQNINSPKSFIVPSSGIPRSPFIAKVKSGEETFTKKEIPIR